MSMKSIISVVCLLTAISFSHQHDSVVFTNSPGKSLDGFNLDDELAVASYSQPMIVMLVDNFCLAEFSARMDVYTQTDETSMTGVLPDLKVTIASSVAYASAWLTETNFDSDKAVVEYVAGETQADADIVVVRVKNLAELDAKISDILNIWTDVPFTAVISDTAVIDDTKSREKRAVDVEGEGIEETCYPMTVNGSLDHELLNATDDVQVRGMLHIGLVELIYNSGENSAVTIAFALNSTVNNARICRTNDFSIVGHENWANYTLYNLTNTDSRVELSLTLSFKKWGIGDQYWQLKAGQILDGTVDKTPIPRRDFQFVADTQIYSVVSRQYACIRTPALRVRTLIPTNMNLLKPYYGIKLNQFNGQPFLPGNWTDMVDDCVPLLSEGSWMALITGLIMFWGLAFVMVMLSSLVTNDRMEDPNSKPLQINAQDD